MLVKDCKRYLSCYARFRCLSHPKASPRPTRPHPNQASNSDAAVSPSRYSFSRQQRIRAPTEQPLCTDTCTAFPWLSPFPFPTEGSCRTETRPYSVFSHLVHLTTSSTTDILSDVTDCCNLYSGQPLSKLPESLQGLVSLTHD